MQLQVLIDELGEQGWRVEPYRDATRYKATPPDKNGSIVFFTKAGVGENNRAIKTILADLKRQGFQWPPPDRPRKETVMAEVPKGPAPKSPVPTTGALEMLFAELKAARDLRDMIAESLTKADADLAAATKRVESCRKDLADASAELNAAKKRFDKMCGIE